jgi:uncharacterized protein YndB with AHSA1/START domain
VTIKVEETVVIQRPREEVFASVANSENWGWLRPVPQERAQASLERVDVGTVFRPALNLNGQSVEMLCEVTDYEPDERLAIACAREDMSFMMDLILEPVDGGTRLTCTGEGNMRGFINNLIEPLVSQGINEQVKASLESLRELLNSGGPPNT